MDYHDLKILGLEASAIEHMNQARLAFERGDEIAAEEIQRWQNTLEKIRQMKNLETTDHTSDSMPRLR